MIIDSKKKKKVQIFISCLQLVGKVGSIHRVTEKGDIRVQYEGTDNRWTICPNALTKVCSYSVGDYVRINNDEEAVKNLQKGHGEWTENMKAVSLKTKQNLN